MHSLFLLILLFAHVSLDALMLCGFEADPTYEEYLCTNIEDMRVEFEYNTGKFISIHEGYGKYGILKPMSCSDEYRPFLDLRGIVFNNGKCGATCGIGYRESVFDTSVMGINLYYDYLRGECKNNFSQVGFGFEWLHDCFDTQINGYLPVGKQSRPCFKKGVEFAYKGFDASLGSTLVSYCGYNLYAAAGTYYFYQMNQHHFWGTFGRLELDWRSLISVQARFSSDPVYGKNVQGIVQISFPLELFYVVNCHECYRCRDLLSLPVRRIGVILLDHCCKRDRHCISKR